MSIEALNMKSHASYHTESVDDIDILYANLAFRIDHTVRAQVCVCVCVCEENIMNKRIDLMGRDLIGE